MKLHPDIERVALLGWHLYPCSRTTRKACFPSPTQKATCDLDQLEAWTREFRNPNWRVVFGPSGMWGLDCDVPPGHPHDGVAGLKALTDQHGQLPKRPTARSGGGGLVVFFKHTDEKIIGDGGHPALGIDPRRGAQSQVIPPSIHITTRKPYHWILPPWEVSAPKAPDWLLGLVKPPPQPAYKSGPIDTEDFARNRLYKAASAVMNAGDGVRNDTLNRRSYQVGIMVAAGVLGESEAVEALYAAARAAGLDHGEASATIKSGFRASSHKGAEWQTTR